MSLPLLLTEGIHLLTDKNGNLADLVDGGATTDPAFQSTHGKWRLATQSTLVGRNGLYECDVTLFQGEPSLRTFGIQAIESLRGFDPQCDVWFYIGTELDSGGVGNPGDTIQVIIEAGDDPVLFPKVDVTYTLTAGDTDEEVLSLNLANFLNLDPVFKDLWRAQRIQGNGVIYITARKPGGQYERPNDDDFKVIATGTTTVSRFDDKVVRRNKITGLARDPVDPRQGQLGIQGSVVQSEGDVTNRFQTIFPNLLVNGSVTPVEFSIAPDPTEVRFISSIAFSARGNGIKYGQFLSKSGGPLTNGVGVEFKSNDITVIREPLKTTDDMEDLHAEDPDNFQLAIQSGGDKILAVLQFGVPLELRPQGEFAIDDYLKITINDNLSSGISELRAIVTGFNREF